MTKQEICLELSSFLFAAYGKIVGEFDDLYDEHGLDEMDIMQLIVEAEDSFGIEITEDNYTTVRTISQIADCVLKSDAYLIN
jgi:acyl carrier protein